MSYDFSMRAGSPNELSFCDIFDIIRPDKCDFMLGVWTDPFELNFRKNYTYNVSSMYYHAFGIGGEGINILRNKTGQECSPLIKKAICKFYRNAKLYKTWNPKNNWGNYEGALEVLITLLTWCKKEPGAVMQIT